MSKIPQFSAGELVNVTIRGARVGVLSRSAGDTFATLALGSHSTVLPLNAPGVTVERVAPAEWPPQVGDVWQDRNKAKWFGTERTDGVRLTSARGDTWSDFGEVLTTVGPMRLLFRDGWTPAADTTPADATPEQVDERAEVVAGYRALADLIESHPELVDLPRYVNWHTKSPENLDEWVRVLDLRTSDHPHENTIQHWAEGKLRGLILHGNWTENLPAAQPDEPVEDDQGEADPEAPVPAPAEGGIARPGLALVGELPHRVPDADAESLLADTLADGAA